jgi:hypothetical protein
MLQMLLANIKMYKFIQRKLLTPKTRFLLYCKCFKAKKSNRQIDTSNVIKETTKGDMFNKEAVIYYLFIKNY